MPFPKETSSIPTTVDSIAISISNNAADTQLKAVASFELKDVNGNTVKTLPLDILAHLSPAQILTLKNFLVAIRTKAQTEIIP